jgi:hypothetical protein
MSDRAWPVRTVPAALRDRYRESGLWRDDTLGALLDRSLAENPGAAIHVWS